MIFYSSGSNCQKGKLAHWHQEYTSYSGNKARKNIHETFKTGVKTNQKLYKQNKTGGNYQIMEQWYSNKDMTHELQHMRGICDSHVFEQVLATFGKWKSSCLFYSMHLHAFYTILDNCVPSPMWLHCDDQVSTKFL